MDWFVSRTRLANQKANRGCKFCFRLALACLVVLAGLVHPGDSSRNESKSYSPIFRISYAANSAGSSAPGNHAPQNLSPANYQNSDPSVAYVGDEPCKACHLDIYASFKKTGMGRSIALPSLTDALGEFRKPANIQSAKPGLTFSSYVKEGKVFHRKLQTDPAGKTVYSDTREVAYAVGSGHLGRSYLVANGDFLFLSPLSFYSRPAKWELSPGYSEGLYEGFSRPIVDLCVYCHTGLPDQVPGTLNRFKRPPFRILAIGCERCHGPGALHVAQRTRGEPLQGAYDASIVNPAELPHGLRDNVCEQCHLAGDARVLRPGKSFVDYRPGTALDSVVAIFSVPLPIKNGGPEAISQVAQMKMSRCWVGSQGKLGCITCHDPHAQPPQAQAVQYFKAKCLACHTQESCHFDMKIRQATTPPDNCVGCHMPQRTLTTIAHAALTDHRILRRPNAPGSGSLGAAALAAFQELIHETAPAGEAQGSVDLRTQALAYAQLAENYPIYAQKGRDLLERAAQEYPQDAEVQSTFGLTLLAQSQSDESNHRAAQALERAIALHSTSAAVRTRLAELKFQGGYVNAAITLLEEALKLEPYYAPARLALGRGYLFLGDRKKAIESFERVLSFDPGNESARNELETVQATPGK
jgi:predicted negative regulator of RcsB-dependent stress response